MRDIGHVVRAERLRQGLTQAALAGRIDTTQRWISEIENGKASAEIGQVLRCIQALGLAIEIARPDPEPPVPTRSRVGRPSLDDVLDRLAAKSIDD